MKPKKVSQFLCVAILLAAADQVLARHVTHPVTPQNIDKQPFSFTVHSKDVGEFKEFEIIVKQKVGHPAPIASATGYVEIAPRGKKQAACPDITRLQSNGVQTYTFRIPSTDLDRSYFTFTETPEDWRVPFPFPGDYWIFNLSDFVESPKK
jgi:hypothetical protein